VIYRCATSCVAYWSSCGRYFEDPGPAGTLNAQVTAERPEKG
jgi:hypothetical protein